MAGVPARTEDPRFQLEPATAIARWFLVAVIVLPLIGVLLIPFRDSDPGGTDPMLLKVYAGIVVVVVLGGVFALLWLAMRRHRLVMDAAGIEVATSFYRRRLTWPELRLDEAKVVSLGEHPDLKPSLKSNGYALPGFRSGWFRSRRLKKMFVASAGGDRMLWIPTTQGYDLLLQPRSPQPTLQRMRELAAMAPRARHR